ncbi:MAG: hypothetical protein AAF564_04195 [Bacteroidota bacterium]
MKSSIYYGLFLFSLFLVVSTLQLGKSHLTYNKVQQQVQAAKQNTPQIRRGEVPIVAQIQRPMLLPDDLTTAEPATDSIAVALPGLTNP